VRDDSSALTERLSGGAGEPAGLPRSASDDVNDFIQQNMNHFPVLEDAAQETWREARLVSGAVYAGLVAYLTERHGIAVEIVPLRKSDSAMRRFDSVAKRLILSELLPQSSRTFQLASQVALLRTRSLLDVVIAKHDFAHPDSAALARVALANYLAGAILMPYDPFLDAARAVRYDLDLLENRFGASFEQVCHRLTTLQRPGASGVPLHFVRVDIAGNISKRFSASGIRFLRFGGACPRWNVHDAFLTPGMIRTQHSVMPDGSAYFCIARTVRKPGGGYRHAQSYLAIGLGCRVADAKALVYSDAYDLTNLSAAVPIGVGCRVCERMNCRQRAFPPIQHRLNVDENVRGFSAYVSADAAPEGSG
jgi:hypothetical protein